MFRSGDEGARTDACRGRNPQHDRCSHPSAACILNIRRNDDAGDGRARIVHFTKRGKAAWDRIYEILVEVEAEWRTTLGGRQFEQLKKLLCKLWDSGLVQ